MRRAAAPAEPTSRGGQALSPALRPPTRPLPFAGASAAASPRGADAVRRRAVDLAAAASHPTLLGQGRHPSIPVNRLMRGTTRSSGRCLRVVTSARISVPLLSRTGGPVPTAQRYPLTVVASCSRLTLAP